MANNSIGSTSTGTFNKDAWNAGGKCYPDGTPITPRTKEVKRCTACQKPLTSHAVKCPSYKSSSEAAKLAVELNKAKIK